MSTGTGTSKRTADVVHCSQDCTVPCLCRTVPEVSMQAALICLNRPEHMQAYEIISMFRKMAACTESTQLLATHQVKWEGQEQILNQALPDLKQEEHRLQFTHSCCVSALLQKMILAKKHEYCLQRFKTSREPGSLYNCRASHCLQRFTTSRELGSLYNCRASHCLQRFTTSRELGSLYNCRASHCLQRFNTSRELGSLYNCRASHCLQRFNTSREPASLYNCRASHCNKRHKTSKEPFFSRPMV